MKERHRLILHHTDGDRIVTGHVFPEGDVIITVTFNEPGGETEDDGLPTRVLRTIMLPASVYLRGAEVIRESGWARGEGVESEVKP